jgi:integrase/recombinase XerD
MRLDQAIDLYVADKRSRGLHYSQSARCFQRFARFAGAVELGDITTESVSAYLGRPKRNTATWLSNYLRLEKFFNFWTLRQEMAAFRMPPRPSRSRTDVHAYVYTAEEMKRMLGATSACQSRANCRIQAETLAMCLILLCATGIAVCELLDLRWQDVDFGRSQLDVWNSKYRRRRIVPIGKDLRRVLRAFQNREASRTVSAALVCTKSGTPITASQLTYAFARLRSIAHIAQNLPKAHLPRLLDFRTTFAVGRIHAWIRDGVEANRMLPALAAYLGQSGLGSIDKYLDLTPDSFLSQLAALGVQKFQASRLMRSHNDS